MLPKTTHVKPFNGDADTLTAILAVIHNARKIAHENWIATVCGSWSLMLTFHI